MHAVNSVLELVGLKGPIPSVQACDHPLDPLSAAELQECVNIVRQDIPLGDTADTPRLWFKGLQLIEPSKRVLAPYLDKWHAAVEHGERMTPLPRQASVLFGVKQSGHTEWFGKLTLSLTLLSVN
jgi:Cu2+-containing amine oxidase